MESVFFLSFMIGWKDLSFFRYDLDVCLKKVNKVTGNICNKIYSENSGYVVSF